jgi:predicted DNA-binding transcriptional regulator YafY
MPLNVGLKASARIELLDGLLRHDRWWTKGELLTEVCRYSMALHEKMVSDATLRNDLEEIKLIAGEHYLEDTRGHGKKIFRYDDRNYSIYNIQRPDPLDYDYLEQAIHILQQVKGFAISQELKILMVKLKYAMPASSESPLVVFDGPEQFEGMELMQQVYDAIVKQQVIHFLYQPFNEKLPQDVTMHPYLLKEYNNRWFLVGLAIPQQKIWVCGLDRFKTDPKPRPRVAFISPAAVGFHPLTYFADVIGPTVLLENPVEKVMLKFSANRTPYVLTKPLHSSQQLEKAYNDGSVSLSYRLRFNKELLGLILGFGADVQVLAPKGLKHRLRAAIDNMVRLVKPEG